MLVGTPVFGHVVCGAKLSLVGMLARLCICNNNGMYVHNQEIVADYCYNIQLYKNMLMLAFSAHSLQR